MLRQIQESIAQTQRRQSEALGNKKKSARATAAAFARRSQAYRNTRGRRNPRAIEQQGSDEEDYANGRDRGKDSSSADKLVTDVKPKRYKKLGLEILRPLQWQGVQMEEMKIILKLTEIPWAHPQDLSETPKCLLGVEVAFGAALAIAIRILGIQGLQGVLAWLGCLKVTKLQ